MTDRGNWFNSFSVYEYIFGLLFNTISISSIIVSICSYFYLALPSVFFKRRLTERINIPKNPPVQGAPSILNFH